MKRSISFAWLFAFALCLPVTSTYAQGRGNAGRPDIGPSVTQHDHGKVAKGPAEVRHDDFQTRIEHTPELNAKITPLLPAGMDLRTAATGFKNQGQFIAALHISKNLDIPFTELRARMTGPNGESLGRAIHDLKPSLSEADAKKEAEKAEKQAKLDAR